MTPGVQELLKLAAKPNYNPNVGKKAVEEGMRTMLHDGILKAIEGINYY
jgi:hypothetical protein